MIIGIPFQYVRTLFGILIGIFPNEPYAVIALQLRKKYDLGW